MDILDPDISKAVDIAPDIWWVGSLDQGSPFQRHPYLLRDHREAVLFEPGSLSDFPLVYKKVSSLIPLNQIRYIVLSHQDPDLCGSLPEWRKVLRKDVQVITHSRTAVFLRHYGADFAFHAVDQINWELRLSSGRKFSFLFAPWCHCPGTFMTYDEASHSLFSGDIFGAISYQASLYAKDGYEKAMFSFHEDYMASSAHLNHALTKLKSLEIGQICPQHGSIIRNDTAFYIRALLHLRCGLDLIQEETPRKEHFSSPPERFETAKAYRNILAMMIEREISVLGKNNALPVIREIAGIDVDDQGNLTGVIETEAEGILERLLTTFEKRFGTWAVLSCRMMLYDLFREYGVEIPLYLRRSSPDDHFEQINRRS